MKDIPLCNLKTCKYYQDGNCTNKDEYYLCNYTVAKLLKFKVFCETEWIDNALPKNAGMYRILLLDTANDIILESTANFNGNEFIYNDYCNIIAWKKL